MADAPEFHIVVRRPDSRGPLAPYRFVIMMAIALLVAGGPMWRALQTGIGIDAALIRFGVAALFAWIVVGKISRILGSAPPPRRTSDEPGVTS